MPDEKVEKDKSKEPKWVWRHCQQCGKRFLRNVHDGITYDSDLCLKCHNAYCDEQEELNNCFWD